MIVLSLLPTWHSTRNFFHSNINFLSLYLETSKASSFYTCTEIPRKLMQSMHMYPFMKPPTTLQIISSVDINLLD